MTISTTSQASSRILSVRLASCKGDIEAAQKLRWNVFCAERGARLDQGTIGLDADPFDDVCDHLLVEDLASGVPVVVGTYRLLRESIAQRHGGFYTAGEYVLESFPRSTDPHSELLELGRSCVAPAYRDAGTIQLLWRGIASYLERHRISMMFGCASFHGADPDDHADSLSYLFHNHLAPPHLRARALDRRHVEMARLPIGGYDPRLAMRKLPPLIKGYLRVGAMVGDGAVIDEPFNTVDVFMVMPVASISARYLGRFGAVA